MNTGHSKEREAIGPSLDQAGRVDCLFLARLIRAKAPIMKRIRAKTPKTMGRTLAIL